jgi:hypothetical protein
MSCLKNFLFKIRAYINNSLSKNNINSSEIIEQKQSKIVAYSIKNRLIQIWNAYDKLLL